MSAQSFHFSKVNKQKLRIIKTCDASWFVRLTDEWRFCFYFFSSKQRKLSFSENLLGDSGENIEIIAIAKYLWHPPTFQDKMADIDLLRCLEHETSKLYKFETQMDTKQIQNDLLVAKNRLLEGKSRIGKSRKLYYSRDDLQKDLEQKFQR